MQPIEMRYSGYVKVDSVTLIPDSYIQIRVPQTVDGKIIYTILEIKVLADGGVEMYADEPVSFKSFDEYNFSEKSKVLGVITPTTETKT